MMQVLSVTKFNDLTSVISVICKPRYLSHLLKLVEALYLPSYAPSGHLIVRVARTVNQHNYVILF